MEIVFAKHSDLDHFERLHGRLKEILHWMKVFLNKSKASRLIYTSIYRPYFDEVAKGRSGVHGFHRAADVVIYKKDGTEFDQLDYDRMAAILNKLFYYGDNEKHNVAVSTPHGTGKHLHLQARDETVYRWAMDSKEIDSQFE